MEYKFNPKVQKLKQVLDYCHIPYDKDDYGMGVQLDFEFEDD